VISTKTNAHQPTSTPVAAQPERDSSFNTAGASVDASNTHAPASQRPSQRRPHAPQFSASLVSSTHCPPHATHA
jgi:hypothetical protein